MSEKGCHTGRWVETSLRMRCRFRNYRMFRVLFITCELGDTSCMIVSIDDFLMYEVKLSSFSMNYVICSVSQLSTWICFSFLILMLIDNLCCFLDVTFSYNFSLENHQNLPTGTALQQCSFLHSPCGFFGLRRQRRRDMFFCDHMAHQSGIFHNGSW